MLANIKGSTILESIIAISVLSLFVLIFGATYTLISTGQFLKHKNLAYYLALEEIEILRQVPFADLTNQTDSPFIGTAYNTGTWTVSANASAPSLPNIYKLNSSDTNPVGLTGLAVIPGFEYNDFTIESKILIDNSSPINWESGIFFRYNDAQNYYYAGFNASELVLNKVVAGVKTELNSSVNIYSKDTWYTLKIVASGSSIIIYMDGVEKINITNDEFTVGRLALAGYNSPQAYFDNVAITTTSTVTWGFDSDDVGDTAEAWQRFGINDLPSGVTKLTIEDDQPGYSTIKKITAKIDWQEKNNLKSVEIITLINQ